MWGPGNFGSWLINVLGSISSYPKTAWGCRWAWERLVSCIQRGESNVPRSPGENEPWCPLASSVTPHPRPESKTGQGVGHARSWDRNSLITVNPRWAETANRVETH